MQIGFGHNSNISIKVFVVEPVPKGDKHGRKEPVPKGDKHGGKEPVPQSDNFV